MSNKNLGKRFYFHILVLQQQNRLNYCIFQLLLISPWNESLWVEMQRPICFFHRKYFIIKRKSHISFWSLKVPQQLTSSRNMPTCTNKEGQNCFELLKWNVRRNEEVKCKNHWALKISKAIYQNLRKMKR